MSGKVINLKSPFNVIKYGGGRSTRYSDGIVNLSIIGDEFGNPQRLSLTTAHPSFRALCSINLTPNRSGYKLKIKATNAENQHIADNVTQWVDEVLTGAYHLKKVL